jgi:hypothetical protein
LTVCNKSPWSAWDKNGKQQDSISVCALKGTKWFLAAKRTRRRYGANSSGTDGETRAPNNELEGGVPPLVSAASCSICESTASLSLRSSRQAGQRTRAKSQSILRDFTAPILVPNPLPFLNAPALRIGMLTSYLYGRLADCRIVPDAQPNNMKLFSISWSAVLSQVLYCLLYIFIFVLCICLTIWSFKELIKACRGKIPYYINDVTLHGNLDSTDAATLSNLIRLRVVEISEDLKNPSLDQQDGFVKKFGSAEKRTEDEHWKFPKLGTVVNQIGDLKLNIAGFDLSSLLTSLQNMVTGSRTLRFTVTRSDHYVTVGGDVGIFDPNDRFLTITIPTDQSSGDAFAFQIADKIAWEILRHQTVGKEPPVPRKEAANEKNESNPKEFRTFYFTRTTELRARRNPSLEEARRQILAQIDYAWDYLVPLFKRVAGSGAELPAKPKEVRLLPEDMRQTFFTEHDQAQPETVYNAPPMVRFIPDKTFGQMAFLFLVKLKNGALRQTDGPALPNESSAILDSYIDILGAVLNKQLLGEEKNGTRWPLIQIGGKNWYDGADLSTLKNKEKDTPLKPLRSLQSPGTCEGDFQVAQWDLHVDGYDMINDVHQNSGILNRAFYEASQRIGVEKATEIWLKGLQEVLPDDRTALQNKPLKILNLSKKISSVAGCTKVDEALLSVGVACHLSGRVQDESGDALPNATIRVAGHSAATDATGRFDVVIPGIPGGRTRPELELDAMAPGYSLKRVNVAPNANEQVVILARTP